MENYIDLKQAKSELSFLQDLIRTKEAQVENLSKKFRAEMLKSLFPKGVCNFLNLKVLKYPFTSSSYSYRDNLKDTSHLTQTIGGHIKHFICLHIELYGEVQLILPKVSEVLEWIQVVNLDPYHRFKIKRAKNFDIGTVGVSGAMSGKNIYKIPKKDYICIIISFLDK
jgi:hypothetical protein